MLPLAVSGVAIIGTVVGGCLALAFVLMRMESRDDVREQAERAERAEEPH